MMVEQKFFEDFTVGESFGIPSKTIHDGHFIFFAGLNGDAHPIHYDDEYCKKHKFGRRVAHGLLLTAMISALLLAGGLNAIQAAMIIGAVPFSFMMILMGVALIIALIRDDTQAR